MRLLDDMDEEWVVVEVAKMEANYEDSDCFGIRLCVRPDNYSNGDYVISYDLAKTSRADVERNWNNICLMAATQGYIRASQFGECEIHVAEDVEGAK